MGEGVQLKDVLADTAISVSKIDVEFTKIASLLAQYNERYIIALHAHLSAKQNLESTHAQRYLTIRELREQAHEKVTEAQLKACVDSDPEYVKAKVALIDAEVEKARCAGIMEAMKTKRDALISLGAHMRAEMQGGLSIRGDRSVQEGHVDLNYTDDPDFSIDLDSE